MKGNNMNNYTTNGFTGVAGAMLAALPGTLSPDALVQLVSIICSVAVALTTVGLQIYTAIKKRNDGGAEYLKGLDVKTLDQLIDEIRAREAEQATEQEDADEYAPVTLPNDEEE